MLGTGCPWRNSCAAQSGYNRKNYCNTSSGWRKCPHRPMNYGNQEIENRYRYRKSDDTSVKIFWGIVIAVAIIWFLTR